MKQKLLGILILIAILFATQKSQAQYVTIPDTNFVNWLNANGYAGCMNGNMMDTTCGAVVNAAYVNCSNSNISDLTGIEYFDSLTYLNCSENQLAVLPTLPSALTKLYCYNNQLSSLISLPNTLAYLYCSDNQLTSLPNLPNSLSELWCNFNQLTNLPTLPNSLTYLYCYDNQLTSLPALPNSLTELNCGRNQLTSLPTLPNSVTSLDCYENQLISLPTLSNTLLFLYCSRNQLSSLPIIPNSLQELACSENQILNLPTLPNTLYNLGCSDNQLTSILLLPDSLKILGCGGNQISNLPTLPYALEYLDCKSGILTSLPTLPSSLIFLGCENNQLTILPTLPDSLDHLRCSNNLLTALPALPSMISSIICANNQLTSLPLLPDSLFYFMCSNNPDLKCLPKIKKINYFYFYNTGIQCLPNYIEVLMSSPNVTSLLLCDTGNIYGCVPYWNISGKVYLDTNFNCLAENSEPKIKFVKLNLFKDSILQQTTYSNIVGNYAFDSDTGLYTISIDTISKPFIVMCPISISDSALISGNDTMRYNKNFALSCKPGFDVGTTSIALTSGIFRPANFANIKILAGDISNHYGLHCAAGTSGAMQIIITGPTTYTGTVNGALTPTVNGDTLTYTIADFGLVDFDNDFQIQVQTDTLAQLGQQVCFDVSVTPTIGDNHPANNTLTHCFTVVNSYDPNLKSVYPINTIADKDGKLTYTIQFQNTGNAPAQHIYVMDTLDGALDASTFELLAYSVQPQVQLIGNVLRFNFPNINLPDSTNDEPNSHGYVQFSIKLKDSLPQGTVVSNTSFIYFDYNPPIQTNTVTDTLTDCDNLIANAWFAKKSLCKNDTLFAAMELQYPYSNIKWLVDNVLAATGDSVAISNIGLGTHTIKVVIKTQYCLSKTYYTITVNDLPQPSLGNDTTACAGLVLDGGTSFTNYLWNTGASTQTIIANNSAAYTVTVTDANGCKANDVIVATINPNPQILFNAFVIDTLCKNAGIQTINAPTPIGGTLTGNGLSGLSFDPSAVSNGWNYFMYAYTDSNSCSNTAIDSLWVDDCLGINSAIGNIYFMVTPNPTNDNINITTNLQSNNCTAILYDMLGKELKSQKLNSNHTQMNLQGLSEGNYMLKVMDGESLIGVKRVVKMK